MKALELTEKAIAWLKREYPSAVIVTEFSVADWGGARVDVAAITDTEVVGIEIKGEGDSPARLELQGLAYGRVVRKMWLLADESIQAKCFAKLPGLWGRLELWEGDVRAFNRATKLGRKIKLKNGYRYEHLRDESRYDPDAARESPLLCPNSMCGTLWRDELYEIARLAGVEVRGKANVWPLTQAICEQLPAPTIHALMIEQLRKRDWRNKRVIDTREKSPALGVQEVML